MALRDRIFTGQTDRSGVLAVSFPVPEESVDPNATLEVTADVAPVQTIEADADAADAYPPPQAQYSDIRTVAQPVYIGHVYDMLLSTDKPVYQPGQTIHTRILALNSLALHAADALSVTLTFADPEGNKLLRQEVATSTAGVASLDLPLDSQAMSGDYVITAELGPTVSTRTVNVKPYTLPRFEVTFQPDKPYYLPGETATGVVEARYFFGKPVADAQVVLRSCWRPVCTSRRSHRRNRRRGPFHLCLPRCRKLQRTTGLQSDATRARNRGNRHGGPHRAHRGIHRRCRTTAAGGRRTRIRPVTPRTGEYRLSGRHLSRRQRGAGRQLDPHRSTWGAL